MCCGWFCWEYVIMFLLDILVLCFFVMIVKIFVIIFGLYLCDYWYFFDYVVYWLVDMLVCVFV